MDQIGLGGRTKMVLYSVLNYKLGIKCQPLNRSQELFLLIVTNCTSKGIYAYDKNTILAMKNKRIKSTQH